MYLATDKMSRQVGDAQGDLVSWPAKPEVGVLINGELAPTFRCVSFKLYPDDVRDKFNKEPTQIRCLRSVELAMVTSLDLR